MAEPISLALATAGIPGIFTSCIQCFEYIQFGKSFGKDYEKYLLKLDLVCLRLTRWWETLNSENITLPPSLSSDKHLCILKSTLEDIHDDFEAAKELAERYKSRVLEARSCTNLDVYSPEKDLPTHSRPVHSTLREIAKQRQNNLSLPKKAIWALYDRNRCNALIENVTERVDSLVALFPVKEFQTIQHQFCQEEVEKLGDEPSGLAALHKSSQDVDELFGEALLEAVKTRGGHLYQRVTVAGNASVENGDYVPPGSFASGAGNRYVDFDISGENTRVRNGNNYGGKSVFD